MPVTKNFQWWKNCRTERTTYTAVYEPIGKDDHSHFQTALSKWKNEVWKDQDNLDELVAECLSNGIQFIVDGKGVSFIFIEHPDIIFALRGESWYASPTRELRTLNKALYPGVLNTAGSVETASHYNNGVMVSPQQAKASSTGAFRRTGHIPTAIVVHKFLDKVLAAAEKHHLLGAF